MGPPCPEQWAHVTLAADHLQVYLRRAAIAISQIAKRKIERFEQVDLDDGSEGVDGCEETSKCTESRIHTVGRCEERATRVRNESQMRDNDHGSFIPLTPRATISLSSC